MAILDKVDTQEAYYNMTLFLDDNFLAVSKVSKTDPNVNLKDYAKLLLLGDMQWYGGKYGSLDPMCWSTFKNLCNGDFISPSKAYDSIIGFLKIYIEPWNPEGDDTKTISAIIEKLKNNRDVYEKKYFEYLEEE